MSPELISLIATLSAAFVLIAGVALCCLCNGALRFCACGQRTHEDSSFDGVSQPASGSTSVRVFSPTGNETGDEK